MTPGGRFPWLTTVICVAGMAAAAWLFWWAGPSVWVLVHGDRIANVYYIPSQSMLPTLEVNDRIKPLRVDPAALRRGDVIVFRTKGEIRVSRVAALGGDTIALRDGVVTIDGRSAPQRLIGSGPVLDGTPTRILRERFVGGTQTHAILDTGSAPFDDVVPQHVARGSVYVLGDNRDRAADSRVPIEMGGVGQVRLGDVIGLVDTVYWSHTRSHIGRPLDDTTMGDNR